MAMSGSWPSKAYVPTLEHERQIFNRLRVQESSRWFAAINTKNNQYIGSCGLQNLNQSFKSAEATIVLLEKYTNRGFGFETVKCLLYLAFDALKLHKAYVTVLEENGRALTAFQKWGFQKDGILRDYLYVDGQYHDYILMSMLEGEYEEIRRSWTSSPNIV